ncbi:MAG: ATP-binding cassette domain-containing protein [Myxococcota bacterium]
MKTVLDVHIDSFTRDEVDILRDIHWTAKAGEHWVVLGANGAGKSSLLSIVAGYEWPSRGRVAVLGEEYGKCDMRALKARIGWVSSSLFTWLPDRQEAREVAATGIHATIGNWHELSDDDLRRADEALRQIGAHSFRHKRYGVLSQGERQRVMIARALVTRPDLLILDEPCAGLDPGARERLIRDVDALCHSTAGPTLLLVSHHVEEIPPRATHALLLKQGRAVASGPLAEVLTSERLTDLYDHPCTLRSDGARYWLSHGHSVM